MKLKTIPTAGYKIGYGNIIKSLLGLDYYRHEEKNNNVAYFGFNTGTSALLFLLKYLKKCHPNKNQVIVPAYTCYSVPAAIEDSDLKILLCDLDVLTLDFNYDQLDTLINDKTLCVISTHYFGREINKKNLENIKNRKSLIIIEDAAQGGYSIDNLNTVSDYIVISTGRGKPISTVGGGYIITKKDNNNLSYIKKIYSIIPCQPAVVSALAVVKTIIVNIFLNPYLYSILSVLPALKLGETIYPKNIRLTKISKFQRMLFNLEVNEDKKHTRSEVAKYYYEKLYKYSTIRQPLIDEIYKYNPIRFPIYLSCKVLELPRGQCKLLRKHGISRMYPNILSELNEIKSFCINYNDNFPGAEYIVSRLVTLPTHSFLTRQDVKLVGNIIKNYL